MTLYKLGTHRTSNVVRVRKRWHPGCEDPALSSLLRRVSARGATHETTDPVQAARPICCPGCCAAAVIASSDALGVSQPFERVVVGGDFASTFACAPCAAGALS
jgi:hypothetical protein